MKEMCEMRLMKWVCVTGPNGGVFSADEVEGGGAAAKYVLSEDAAGVGVTDVHPDVSRLPERTAGEVDTEATFMWVSPRQVV